MKDITISSQELKNKNASLLPSKASEFANYTFWYYTSLRTADLILKNKCIYVSNINKMNDLDESNIHNSDKEFVAWLYKIYVICSRMQQIGNKNGFV